MSESFDEFTPGMLESIARAGCPNQDVVRKLARFAMELRSRPLAPSLREMRDRARELTDPWVRLEAGAIIHVPAPPLDVVQFVDHFVRVLRAAAADSKTPTFQREVLTLVAASAEAARIVAQRELGGDGKIGKITTKAAGE